MAESDDTRLMRRMRDWAEQTETFYRDVAGQIDNRQLAQVLRNCADDRAGIIARLDDVIAELGDETPVTKTEQCCPREDFRMAANDDYGVLLERLATCDSDIRDRFSAMLGEADVKASTHLIADEALLLLEHTAKKLRRIVAQARKASVSEAIDGE